MTPSEAISEFRAAGAYLEGHFVLSSGLHSPIYLQCARALMAPDRATRLCTSLADKIRTRLRDSGEDIDLCISPAVGGVVLGFETARLLGVTSLFAERVDGRFALRRGFEIPKGSRCLVIEDVITTGGSVREVIDLVHTHSARATLAAALVDRSDGEADLGVPCISLLSLQILTYAADNLPPELAERPPESPGSRRLTV